MKKKLKFHKYLIISFIVTTSLFARSQTIVDTTIFTFVDSMPEYPEGMQAMFGFIMSNIHYPAIAVEKNVTGKVYIGLIVEADGSLSNIKTFKGIGSGCDEEAIRVVSLMPRWKPGTHKGKNVRVSTTIPFSFQLNPENDEPIYNNADVLPVFTESLFNFDYYVSSNLRYPAGISMERIVDTVNILYIVETDGSISDVKLMESKSNLNAFDYEAIRIMKKLSGDFESGYIDEKPVRVRLTVSIVFDYNKIDTLDCELMLYNYDGIDYTYYKQEDVIYTVVEEMPEFPGGMEMLFKFLAKNIHYPLEAKNNNEQGRVFINFAIEKDGSISNARVLRGVSPSVDAEALRVINLMPDWKPGMQRGKPVRVGYNLPVKFNLETGKLKKRKR